MTLAEQNGWSELDAKTRQLIGLGVALYANNEDCVFRYTQEAKAMGISDEQIMGTVAVAASASERIMSQGAAKVEEALKIQLAGSKNSANAHASIASNPLRYQQESDAEFADDEAFGLFGVMIGEVSPSY
ncbi:carboxymuconolactone decarboxylase family protein [Cohnella terricola]|uniref:carboxymuconolactone decarboxylase family protein n=1 Tax=Cohnella terricola TaxID=1289167 RepID=UPI00164802EF|nr:carboxymuconolactone decarboxylase family protein [Cohnella terricola]